MASRSRSPSTRSARGGDEKKLVRSAKMRPAAPPGGTPEDVFYIFRGRPPISTPVVAPVHGMPGQKPEPSMSNARPRLSSARRRRLSFIYAGRHKRRFGLPQASPDRTAGSGLCCSGTAETVGSAGARSTGAGAGAGSGRFSISGKLGSLFGTCRGMKSSRRSRQINCHDVRCVSSRTMRPPGRRPNGSKGQIGIS